MEQRHSMVARSEMAATSVDEFVPEVAPNRRFRILNQLIASSPLDHHKVYSQSIIFRNKNGGKTNVHDNLTVEYEYLHVELIIIVFRTSSSF